jgi:NarL family two-component system response regulator YdfI
MKKKIIIVDDHLIIREGLKAIFKRSDYFEMVADFDNEEELLAYLNQETADVILMDIHLHNVSGIEIAKKTKLQFPGIKIIMHTMTNEPYVISQSKLNGADGFVLKSAGQAALENAIHNVYRYGANY